MGVDPRWCKNTLGVFRIHWLALFFFKKKLITPPSPLHSIKINDSCLKSPSSLYQDCSPCRANILDHSPLLSGSWIIKGLGASWETGVLLHHCRNKLFDHLELIQYFKSFSSPNQEPLFLNRWTLSESYHAWRWRRSTRERQRHGDREGVVAAMGTRDEEEGCGNEGFERWCQQWQGL